MNDKPRPRVNTTFFPESLPANFHYANFLRGLMILDINLRQTLKQIDQAMEKGGEDEIARLAIIKSKQTDALMTFLAKAYLDTEGKIANLPEFDPKSERYFKLAIEDDGQLLWFRIKQRIKQIQDEEQQRIEQVLPFSDEE